MEQKEEREREREQEEPSGKVDRESSYSGKTGIVKKLFLMPSSKICVEICKKKTKNYLMDSYNVGTPLLNIHEREIIFGRTLI